MTGLLISEIAVWSLHRCRPVSQACLPSRFPFWAALGCLPPCLPACLPSFPLAAVGVLTSHSELKAKGVPGFLVPNDGADFRNRQLVANLSLPPHTSQARLPSWFPFWASPGYGCRPLSQASLPPWFPFWAALGYSCLVSQACLLSRWAALWLPPCFVSLSSSFLLGCSWLQQPPCLPALSSFFPFWSYIFGFYVCTPLAASPALPPMHS